MVKPTIVEALFVVKHRDTFKSSKAAYQLHLDDVVQWRDEHFPAAGKPSDKCSIRHLRIAKNGC